jgi:hypothetical protein
MNNTALPESHTCIIQAAYFQGQPSDTYATCLKMEGSIFSWIILWTMSYNEQMQGSLHVYSWKTSWHLYHVMKKCLVANLHGYHFGTNITHRSNAW